MLCWRPLLQDAVVILLLRGREQLQVWKMGVVAATTATAEINKKEKKKVLAGRREEKLIIGNDSEHAGGRARITFISPSSHSALRKI